jgi:hypothetical protein
VSRRTTATLPATLPAIEGVKLQAENDHTLVVEMPREMDLNRVFAAFQQAGITVRSMRNEVNRLEELFVRLTNKDVKEINGLVDRLRSGKEFGYSEFEVGRWEEWCGTRRKAVLPRFDANEQVCGLRRGLAVVVAKSLYDFLQKESTGGRDLRRSTLVQVIRHALNALGCEIRWVDHPAMIVDGMTKLKGRIDAMTNFMREGKLCIMDESETLRLHQETSVRGEQMAR